MQKDVTTSETPIAVRKLIDAWKAEGSPPQHGVDWPREKWILEFPMFESHLEELPNELCREDVIDKVRKTNFDLEATCLAFVLVMAWGYGRVGYGVWRTSKMLSATTDVPEKLLKVREILVRTDAISGYQALRTTQRIRGLGPAFGTKLLYFFGAPERSMTPLILDEMVTSWLNQHVGLSLKPWVWSTKIYQHYLEQMHQWAEDLNVSPVDIETCIFRSEAKTRQGNQWGK